MGGGVFFPCPRCFRLAVPTVLLSRLLEFLVLLAGVSVLSLPLFTDGSGCLADGPWFSALCSLAPGGVALFFWHGPVVLRYSGCSDSGFLGPAGFGGLRDGVTCLRSGLCSSSVHDRNEDFPSFWWVWFRGVRVGSPLAQVGAVFFGLR